MVSVKSPTPPMETSPLLCPPQRNSPAGNAPDRFPTTQIMLLCYARLMEPIAFFSIFPYIAMMVQSRGKLADADVGFYAGLIEAVFSGVQSLVLMFWGSLADRFGRRPVLIVSLTGMAIGPSLFGLSATLWQMVLFRALTGVFSGANLVIRTMIGELCEGSSQAKAIAWYAVAGNMGIICGPIIGGALVDPATQHPSLFGGFAFLKTHPFALPGFVVSSMGLTACISSFLFLEETWDTWRSSASSVDECEDGREADTIEHGAMTAVQLLKNPQVFPVLATFTYVMVLSYGFASILPVYLHTPIPLGGAGFAPSSNTVYMATMGAGEIVWMVLVFPALQKRFQTKGVLRFSAFFWPLFLAGYILMNAAFRAEAHQQTKVWSFIVWAANLAFGSGIWISFAGVQLAVNEVSPSRRVLGKLNSMAEICASVTRTVIPPLSTSLFAIGVGGQILRGYIVWVVLMVLTLGLPVVLHWFPDVEARDLPVA